MKVSDEGIRLMKVSDSIILILAVATLTALGMAAMLIVGLRHPNPDPTALIQTIVSFVAPTIMALLAVLKGVQNSGDIQTVHLALNSRLTQLLQQTAETSKLTERATMASEAFPTQIGKDGVVISSVVPTTVPISSVEVIPNDTTTK